jgi:hypothetical protein
MRARQERDVPVEKGDGGRKKRREVLEDQQNDIPGKGALDLRC